MSAWLGGQGAEAYVSRGVEAGRRPLNYYLFLASHKRPKLCRVDRPREFRPLTLAERTGNHGVQSVQHGTFLPSFSDFLRPLAGETRENSAGDCATTFRAAPVYRVRLVSANFVKEREEGGDDCEVSEVAA